MGRMETLRTRRAPRTRICSKTNKVLRGQLKKWPDRRSRPRRHTATEHKQSVSIARRQHADTERPFWSQFPFKYIFMSLARHDWTGDWNHTVLGVLGLSNTSIRSGSLVVVLRQGQGPDAWTRWWLAARSFRLLQATVIVAVLGGVLQVLHGVGGGEGHSPMGVLKRKKKRQRGQQNETLWARMFSHPLKFSLCLMALWRRPQQDARQLLQLQTTPLRPTVWFLFFLLTL